MPIEIGSFSVGTVVGGVLIGVINRFLTKSRSAEERQISDFNKAATIEPKRISSQATSFFKAASRCSEKRKTGENTFEWLMVPENVCLAFSIELNFKALVHHEGHSPTDSHNLEKLFKQLNGKTQNTIIIESGYDKDLFFKELTNIANTFEFWRYVYEHQDKNFSFNVRMLTILANLLENKVNNIMQTS